ncbi:hypothetical protein PSPO01_03667 [Paraphaeosphaeria sporulosa]
MRGNTREWIQPYVTKYLGMDYNNYKCNRLRPRGLVSA